jgi:hypothetical protein
MITTVAYHSLRAVNWPFGIVIVLWPFFVGSYTVSNCRKSPKNGASGRLRPRPIDLGYVGFSLVIQHHTLPDGSGNQDEAKEFVSSKYS